MKITNRRSLPLAIIGILSICAAVFAIAGGAKIAAQETSISAASPSRFRIGEKLAYNISFGKFNNAGYAETNVVSRGKLGGRDAVEIRSKIKTFEMVSAAFFLLDESRIVFAAPDSGLPIYISSTSNDSAIPEEKISDYQTRPTSSFDLVTLIFKAREVGGAGIFQLVENGQPYTVVMTPAGSVTARTDVGNLDTNIYRLQSEFFIAHGITDVFISLTVDEARVPAIIRFSTIKGEFKAILAAIVLPEADLPTPTPSPTPFATPKPVVAASPTPTAEPEIKPLAPELGFQLGEVLDYSISSGGKALGVVTLAAAERKLIDALDTLVLSATVTTVEPGSNVLRSGDAITASVDPETLAPRRLTGRFATTLAGLNQTVLFDRRSGEITFPGPAKIDAPIGTHSLLSLAYAMRSFNLKPSKTAANPVNDTRVAVFWETKAYIFTLRPSDTTEITVGAEKVSAQLIAINTGVPALDALAIKVWLDPETRVPLRYSFGLYQADLVVRPTTPLR
ncbi:MAG: DUF3108 domain-containing protein [Pyrinomonadaceae bacterium]